MLQSVARSKTTLKQLLFAETIDTEQSTDEEASCLLALLLPSVVRFCGEMGPDSDRRNFFRVYETQESPAATPKLSRICLHTVFALLRSCSHSGTLHQESNKS